MAAARRAADFFKTNSVSLLLMWVKISCETQFLTKFSRLRRAVIRNNFNIIEILLLVSLLHFYNMTNSYSRTTQNAGNLFSVEVRPKFTCDFLIVSDYLWVVFHENLIDRFKKKSDRFENLIDRFRLFSDRFRLFLIVSDYFWSFQKYLEVILP